MKTILHMTRTTPGIKIDKGNIWVEGKSIPTNDNLFYLTLESVMREASTSGTGKTRLDIDMEYINAYSSRMLMLVFSRLEKKRSQVIINWHYTKENEAVAELGAMYQSMLTLPFNMVIKGPT